MASLMILLNQTQSSSSDANTAAEASLNSSRSIHNKNPNSGKLKMELDEANHQQTSHLVDEIQCRKSPRTYLTTVNIKSEHIGKESPNIFRQKLAVTPPPPPPPPKEKKTRIKYHYKQEAYTDRSNDSQLVSNLSTSDEINSCESLSSSSSLSASSPPPTLSDDSPCEYDASKLQQRGDPLQEPQLTVKLNKTPTQLESESRIKKPSSISSSPRSKCTNMSSTSNMATKNKFDKPKKRVSFNDDLLQVHLIPFNNYQNILSVEQYKCQLRMMTQANAASNESKNYNNYEDYEMPIENYSIGEHFEFI